MFLLKNARLFFGGIFPLLSKHQNALKKMRETFIGPESGTSDKKFFFETKNNYLDNLVFMRGIKKFLDENGFSDENGKSEYFKFDMPRVFYIYYRIIERTN